MIERHLLPEDRELRSVYELAEHLLPRGVGMHHGGMLPVLRELAEQFFKDGCIKVLFTTETFALGLNMPSRAIIFNWKAGQDFRKFDGPKNRAVRAGEYMQLAGRAGRRGVDPRAAPSAWWRGVSPPGRCAGSWPSAWRGSDATCSCATPCCCAACSPAAGCWTCS